jgi:hypothetical protein
MGSAEARWGWRVVDGDGVGAVSASELGPAYSSLVLPFPTTLGTRLRLSGVWLWLRLSFICLRLVLWLRISSAYHGGLLSALSVRRLPLSSGLLWIRRLSVSSIPTGCRV